MTFISVLELDERKFLVNSPCDKFMIHENKVFI
jgi:hypothetical protein